MAERLRQSHYREKGAEFLRRLEEFRGAYPVGQIRLTDFITTKAREWARKNYNKLSKEHDLPPIIGRIPTPEYCSLLDREVKPRIEQRVKIHEIARDLHTPVTQVRASRRRILKKPSNLTLLVQALGEQQWGDQKMGEILRVPASTVRSLKMGLNRRGIEMRLRRKRKLLGELAQLDLRVQALREQDYTDEQIATYLHEDYYSIYENVFLTMDSTIFVNDGQT